MKSFLAAGDMAYSLTFDRLIGYDNGRSGIEVDVELRLSDAQVGFKAKIDTGASFCIFSREYGERLGIKIEDGFLKSFLTPTGSFQAYGHWVTLVVDILEFDSQVFFSREEGFFPNVLGRQGWLDRIQLAIVDHKGSLFVSGVDDA
ncbi:MAG: hypothetical protein HOP17_04395 [Acidobacteria bacterium]|nr:hypothetical protein [Acidobacteriota bacterium]